MSETNGKTWQKTKIRGLLRHRGGRYYGRFTLGGKTVFKALETDILEIARTRFAKHKANVEQVRKAARSTKEGFGKMADLFTLYVSRIKDRQDIAPNTRQRYLESAEYIRKTWEAFPSMRPDEITRNAIEEWKARALKVGTAYQPPGAKVPSVAHSGRSPASFNKAADALRAMLDIAVERGALHANPLAVRGIKATHRPKKPKLPDAAVLQAIFAEIEAGSGVAGQGIETADFCRFLCFTGARLNEARGVLVEDVDFGRGIVRIRGTKTEAATREVPLVPAARALLEKIIARRKRTATYQIEGEPFVDPKSPVLRIGEAQKSLNRACEKLKVERLTHHDLRDAFATQAIEAGVDIPTVAAWLGHADGGALLMRVYAHHRRAHSVEQAKKVNFGGEL